MKNRILTIVLGLVCVLASAMPSLVIPKQVIVKENVNLDIANANIPVEWSTLSKDDPYMYSEEYIKAYQEAFAQYYQLEYQKAYQNFINEQIKNNKINPYDIASITQPRDWNNGKGNSAKNGRDGRGIASVDIDANGDLIVKYTDNTTHNAGNVRGENPNPTPTPSPTYDYTQVGYVLTDDTIYPIIKNGVRLMEDSFCLDPLDGTVDSKIDSIKIELTKVDNNNPSNKYEYTCTIKYSLSNIVYPDNYVIDKVLSNVQLTIDSTKNHFNTNGVDYNDSNQYTDIQKFYSPIPYVGITNISCGDVFVEATHESH